MKYWAMLAFIGVIMFFTWDDMPWNKNTVAEPAKTAATAQVAANAANVTPPPAQPQAEVAPAKASEKAAPTKAADEKAVSKTTPAVEHAVDQPSGWKTFWIGVGAFLAGGWFVGTLGVLELGFWFYALFAVFLVPLAVLVEWADPRNEWWGYSKANQPEPHEVAATFLFIAFVALLQWGGVPIWQTITESSWLALLGWFVAYVVGGLATVAHHWDDYSKYLSERRKEQVQEFCSDMLPELVRLEEEKKSPMHGGHNSRGHGQRSHEESFLLKYFAGSEREINSEEIAFWKTQFTDKRIPADFKEHVEQQIPQVTYANYLSQLYLWTMFWPLSVTFRTIRTVIHLKFVRDFFNMMVKLFLGKWLDLISARHAYNVEYAEKPAPTSPREQREGTPAEESNVHPMPRR